MSNEARVIRNNSNAHLSSFSASFHFSMSHFIPSNLAVGEQLQIFISCPVETD